jgi:FixJ family two-component response regulator
MVFRYLFTEDWDIPQSRYGGSLIAKAHRGRVMQKMKAGSLADLVKTAERLRLAPARNP